MRRFKNAQRVRVVAHAHPLSGYTGVVVRLRHGDNAAWVKMDTALPENCALFPKGDSRERHYMLYPDECEVMTP